MPTGRKSDISCPPRVNNINLGKFLFFSTQILEFLPDENAR